MTEPLKVDEESRNFLDEDTVSWFEASELAKDDRTRKVVEVLRTARDGYGFKLNPEIQFALAAAYLFRAIECEVVVDGEQVEEWSDVPASFSSKISEILRGYSSEEACEEHCSSVESRVAAANLQMAVCWAEGRSAPSWAWAVVEDEFGFGPGPSRRRGALQAVARKCLKP